MSKHIKTCISSKTHTKKHSSHDKNLSPVQNNSMEKDKKECKVHVMPPTITDQDISALFNGILLVVKKKIELEKRAEILSINMTNDKLLKELKEKQAECNRLKNEILYLKSQLEEKDKVN